jgi:hypothetical protein
MEAAVKSRLESVQFEEPQIYKNIVIVPLIAPSDGTVRYHTLGESLATKDLTINEVSQSGSVPELMVTNRGNESILLIDGEELAGAKQNRVLNTSILLKELCDTKIPVSCTEQGRWSYTSKFFSDSGNIMAHKTRARKTSSVHLCLQSLGSYGSDQGEVWANISELQSKAGARSPTSAMSDVYKARAEDLRKCCESFTPVANQVGFVAFINGVPAGADILSRATAYAQLHPKLVRSYALEGLLEASVASQPPTGSPPETEASAFTAQARKFLHEIVAAEERQFPSIGHGTDFRYRTPAVPSTTDTQRSSICGTALVHQNEVIHAAFFRLDEPSTPDSQSPPKTSANRSWWHRFTR